MAMDLAPSPADTASRVWDTVAGHLERFAEAWEAGEPPALFHFAPDGPPAVRRLALVELIKLDLEQRLNRGMGRPLEEYLREFAELAAAGPPCDLLYEDYHLRLRSGERVDPADYYRRFPTAANDLARLLGDVRARSTSVFPSGGLVTVQPGDRLDDFDLLALLGEGTFARVFLARQVAMQRLVALKVSATRAAEAQTLAQLDHPHIVHVYDQRALTEPAVHLVYMTYVPGGTLHNVLDHVRVIPLAARTGRTLLEAVDKALVDRGEVRPTGSPVRADWAGRSWPAAVCLLGAKLADALDYAHKHGVLHRDIKPANVLLTADGEPLLADFNLGFCSKVEGAGPAAFFGGSLPYMAPEHLEAFNPAHPRSPETLDGRADVYSLAVTLWELWTGERPFGAEVLAETWPATLEALVERRRSGPPAGISASEGDVPGLREVLLRCLDPDPARRPATAGELARELELCLRPATRALVRPAPGGWREVVKRHPFLTTYPAALIPNVLAAVFNAFYNQSAIVKHWSQEARDIFLYIVPVVNGLFFPLGTVIFFFAVRAATRRPDGIEPLEESAERRARCLGLGTMAAWVCVGCWLVAGLVWPIVLRWTAGPPERGPEAYLHFLTSLAVCGVMAAAYPYFVVTYLAVHVLYPAQLGPAGPAAADAPALRRVARQLSLYRMVVIFVPLVAVAPVALLFLGRDQGDLEHYAFALAILAVNGAIGTVVAWILDGRIRADLVALFEAAEP
ncbi:MAG: serine/threonine protein kinase [Zavarzinella sp.]|nr:serine/threonine protein kinase [Zavarzinella sp.]